MGPVSAERQRTLRLQRCTQIWVHSMTAAINSTSIVMGKKHKRLITGPESDLITTSNKLQSLIVMIVIIRAVSSWIHFFCHVPNHVCPHGAFSSPSIPLQLIPLTTPLHVFLSSDTSSMAPGCWCLCVGRTSQATPYKRLLRLAEPPYGARWGFKFTPAHASLMHWLVTGHKLPDFRDVPGEVCLSSHRYFP